MNVWWTMAVTYLCLLATILILGGIFLFVYLFNLD